MADRIILLCFSLSFSVALFPFVHPQSSDYHPICQNTTMSSLCNAIIDEDDAYYWKTSPSGHLTILSSKAKEYSITTYTQITELLRSNHSPPLESRLRTCLDQYYKVVYVQQNLYWPELNGTTNYPDFMAELGKAMDGVDACRNVLTQFPPLPAPSPINVFNADIKMLIELTLQFLNLHVCKRITSCIF